MQVKSDPQLDGLRIKKLQSYFDFAQTVSPSASLTFA